MHDELKKELEKEDPPHAKAIFDCFKFKKLEEKIKTEEPFTPPQEIIAERAKLERQKTGKWFKILTLNKLLTRPSILLTQIKAENISYKLKYEIKQISNLLYQHNKITKILYNNLINSL